MKLPKQGVLTFLSVAVSPHEEDFSEVYLHAKRKGLVVTVFTNGTLVTNEVLSLFQDYPPYLVEITLYGATPATYEAITGVPGSYARTIQVLSGFFKGIRVKLKTVLMTLNSTNQAQWKNWLARTEFPSGLTPHFSPLQWRPISTALSRASSEAVERELADAERLKSWKEFYEREDGAPVSEQLYVCGAGNTGFHVDPYGILRPCVMVRKITFDLFEGLLKAAGMAR